MNATQYRELLESTPKTKKPANKKQAQKTALLKQRFENDLKLFFGEFQKEVMFAKGERQFRFDYIANIAPIAFELNGGIHNGGRHVNPEGYKRDLDKANLAQIYGYMYFQFTYDHIAKNAHLPIFERIKQTINPKEQNEL